MSNMEIGTYRVIQPRTREGRWTSFKSRAGKFFNSVWFWTKVATGGAVFVVAAFVYGSGVMSNTVYAQNVITVTPKEQMAPVLQRIAGCESEGNAKSLGRHYDKDGQVLMRANAKGTSIDIGKYQINLMYWGKKATELGYDLTVEEDNQKMAEWIYLNKGTGDWSASQHCWNK